MAIRIELPDGTPYTMNKETANMATDPSNLIANMSLSRAHDDHDFAVAHRPENQPNKRTVGIVASELEAAISDVLHFKDAYEKALVDVPRLRAELAALLPGVFVEAPKKRPRKGGGK